MSEMPSYDIHTNHPMFEHSTRLIDYKIHRPLRRSKIVATCFVSRKPGYYLFNAYFLIFIITLASLTIFSVDCKLPQNRLQITCTVLLTSVSFKWVYNRSLPTVSYLTSLDKYGIASIFYICLLCVWHAVVGSFWSDELARKIDFWILIFFSFLFVLINVVVLIWFIHAYRKISDLKKRESDFLLDIKAGQTKFEEETNF